MRKSLFVAWAAMLLVLGSVGAVGASDHPMCGGMPATIIGTDGDDVLFGTPDSDVIVALEGNDTVFGGPGDDLICGNEGNDFLIGQQGEDHLWGDNGSDIVIGGPDNDVVHGGNGRDLLFGNFGDDYLDGGNGKDFLNGDLPFPADQSPAPPGAYEDPYPNNDTCDGGNATDAATFCENETSIEEHPDPSTIIFE